MDEEDTELLDLSHVAVIKLVTNETLISEIVEETDEFMVLRRPLSLNNIYDRDGELNIAYKIWMPYCGEDIIVLRKNAMVALCVASDYYANNYLVGIKEMVKYKTVKKEVTKADTPKEKTHNEDNIIFLNPDKSSIH